MVESPAQTAEPALARLLGKAVVSLERIGGGRNSQVYRVTCKDASRYAAKFYPRFELDERDRLRVEFSSLEFLWRHGIRCVPLPVGLDPDTGCGIYECVEGERIPPAEATGADVEEAVEFLGRLRELVNVRESRDLPVASEAFFSAAGVAGNIEARWKRLLDVRGSGPQYGDLRNFLKANFRPAFDEIVDWCRFSLARSGMSFDSELAREARTLNPSDFGFHNALRRRDGRIIFMDFEYFGWDDPAKMVCDFLLHPAMKLRKDLKRSFVTGILGRFKDVSLLPKRVEILYPLFGLKWCMIFLNDFLAGYRSRNTFAENVSAEVSDVDVQREQLSKAKRMLNKVRKGYQNFPYHG